VAQYDLRIKSVRLQDEGVYTCIDKAGMGMRKSATLSVLLTSTSTTHRQTTTMLLSASSLSRYFQANSRRQGASLCRVSSFTLADAAVRTPNSSWFHEGRNDVRTPITFVDITDRLYGFAGCFRKMSDKTIFGSSFLFTYSASDSLFVGHCARL